MTQQDLEQATAQAQARAQAAVAEAMESANAAGYGGDAAYLVGYLQATLAAAYRDLALATKGGAA